MTEARTTSIEEHVMRAARSYLYGHPLAWEVRVSRNGVHAHATVPRPLAGPSRSRRAGSPRPRSRAAERGRRARLLQLTAPPSGRQPGWRARSPADTSIRPLRPWRTRSPRDSPTAARSVQPSG